MLPQAQQRPATILIVDDEPVQLRAILTELKGLGFETLIARDGADGLAKAERGHPDLILLDILMPGWDGYETCRRLQAPLRHDAEGVSQAAAGKRKQRRGAQGVHLTNNSLPSTNLSSGITLIISRLLTADC